MVALLTVVVMSIVIGVQNSTKSAATAPVDTVCLSSSCIDLSTAVRQALNEDIDPCEDFYNFSCGGWEKRNVIPPSTLSFMFPLMGLQCALTSMPCID